MKDAIEITGCVASALESQVGLRIMDPCHNQSRRNLSPKIWKRLMIKIRHQVLDQTCENVADVIDRQARWLVVSGLWETTR
jgi:hypothetical protein